MRNSKKHIVYLALGSNLGDREANLRQAREALEPEIHLLDSSPIYETEPWGYREQPHFLNQAVKAETELGPGALLETLKRIETNLGRSQTIRYGPRVIDIDILFYENLIMVTDRLTIPHPHLSERAFVLTPLADIAPHLFHPVLGKNVVTLLREVDRSGIRPYLEKI